MTRKLLMAAAFQLVMASTAFACEGQVGASIFEDKFADDSGGWDLDVNSKIVPPALEMTLGPDVLATAAQNLTFNASDGQYCEAFAFPPSIVSNPLSAGVEFWATDYSNFYLFLVTDDQTASLYKKVAGNWTTVLSQIKLEGFDAAPGATHTILIDAKAGVLKFSVDGKAVKTVRAQVPSGPLRFGPYAQGTNKLEAATVFRITEFSVTDGV